MDRFPFGCNNSINAIRCIYTYYNGEVSEKTSWEGYIIIRNVDGVLDIEGYEIDKMDSLEQDGTAHKRYILGIRAISYADETLSFEIYPGNIAPIHYDMFYKPDDSCFYGRWHFAPSPDHPYSPVKGGEAIILIKDEIVDKQKIITTIQQIANRFRREYSKEIDTYETLAKCQLLPPSDKSDYSIVMRLSNYQETLRD